MRDDSLEPTKGAESQDSGNESTYRSVAALAAEIGLSERSTRSELRRGDIPHIRIGRRFILPKTAIAEWLRTAGQSLQTAAQAGGRTEPVASAGHSEVSVMTRAIGRR